MNAPTAESPDDTTLDKVAKWLALVFATLGVLLYSVGLITELDRIARDFWEDGIVLGLCYCSLTLVGILRTFRPHLPREFHLASAFANVLIGYVLVMFWVGVFYGMLDRGAEFVPVLMTIAYVIVLRAIRIDEHFRLPLWLIAVVFLATTLNFVVQIPKGTEFDITGFSRVATIGGSIQLITSLIWITFLIVGKTHCG